ARRTTMGGPGDFPFGPGARTPVFYGSLDWHSAVEMHWLLMRLLRTAGDDVPVQQIRKRLRAQFSPVALAVEADYIAGPGRTSQRPTAGAGRSRSSTRPGSGTTRRARGGWLRWRRVPTRTPAGFSPGCDGATTLSGS